LNPRQTKKRRCTRAALAVAVVDVSGTACPLLRARSVLLLMTRATFHHPGRT